MDDLLEALVIVILYAANRWVLMVIALYNAVLLAWWAWRVPGTRYPAQGIMGLAVAMMGVAGFYLMLALGGIDLILFPLRTAQAASRVAFGLVLGSIAISATVAAGPSLWRAIRDRIGL